MKNCRSVDKLCKLSQKIVIVYKNIKLYICQFTNFLLIFLDNLANHQHCHVCETGTIFDFFYYFCVYGLHFEILLSCAFQLFVRVDGCGQWLNPNISNNKYKIGPGKIGSMRAMQVLNQKIFFSISTFCSFFQSKLHILTSLD